MDEQAGGGSVSFRRSIPVQSEDGVVDVACCSHSATRMYFMKRLKPSVTRSDSLQGLPDILEPGLSVVFCGINPGVCAASTGRHFAGRGNRFWRAVHLAGFTPQQIRPEDDRTLLQYGCGLTTAVSRPTARADELSQWEFDAAATEFERKIERYAPQCVAFLGKMALSAMSGRRDIYWGLQPTAFGGARAWVLPNPSGLNRTFSLDALVIAYRELRLAVATAGSA
jgi:double-stranded uracil-DNA glycosylase